MLHETLLDDDDLWFLIGHLYGEEGKGADLYQKFRRLAIKDGLKPRDPLSSRDIRLVEVRRG
jgi:hypothetical protein